MTPQMRAHIKQYGPKKGLGTLLKNYHCTWMTFLVFQGVYGYDEGDFWSSIAEAVGIDDRQTLTVWGRLFNLSLERFDLPTFPDQEGHRYVARILLHGGIPQSALPRFFDSFVSRALSEPGLFELGPNDLIDRLLENTTVYYSLTKPSRRFLEAGGRIAEDFVARCLELAVTHTETGQLPSANDIGLPERVVQAYSSWKSSDVVLPNSSYRSRHRLQRPHIQLDAYGDGVVVILPGQSLPRINTSPVVHWTINLDDTLLSQPVRSYQRRDGWQTEDDSVILSRPFSECRISIEDGRGLTQSWRVTGIDSTIPILVFDGETGRIQTWKNRIAAGHCWLVYPQTFTLTIDNGRLLEDADRLAWDWGNYRAERWDLSQAKEIHLTPKNQQKDSDKSILILVAQDQSSIRPWLDGGNIVPSIRSGSGNGDVYSGYPPTIRIPISAQRDIDDEIGRWNISLININSGQRAQFALADIDDGLSVENSIICLDLIKANLLDKDPFGVFEIALRGPLGRDTSFTIACVPNLSMDRPQVRVARPEHPEPVSQLQIRCADSFTVDTVTPEIVVAQISPGRFSVSMPPHIHQAELRILPSAARGDTHHEEVFIQIAAPILRWAIVQGSSVISANDWRVLPLHQPIAWLEQANRPQLVVSIAPTMFNKYSLSGYLSVTYDSSGKYQIVQADAIGKRFLRFDLRELLDTARASSLAKIWCRLELEALGDYHTPVSVPVFFLSQHLDVAQMNLVAVQNLEQWELALSWLSPRPLENRQIAIWSISRPWVAPVLCPVPDDIQDHYFTWTIPTSSLAPGKYRVEMSIEDVWIGAKSTRPSNQSPNCIDVEIGSKSDQFTYMASLPETTSGYLERALMFGAGVPHSTALAAMAQQFAVQDIPFALNFLLYLIRDEGVDGIFSSQYRVEIDMLRPLLILHPYTLFQKIAEIVPLIGQEQQGELKSLLVILGACSCPIHIEHQHERMNASQMELVWSLWPVLGVILESHDLVRGDVIAWRRGDARLGLSTLIPDPQGEEGDLQTDGEADSGYELPGLPNLRKLCGGEPEDRLLQIPASILESIQDELHIVPSGLLVESQWNSANFAWLLACKKNPELEIKASQWLRSHIEWLVAGVQALAESKLVDPEILKLVEQRFTSRDHNALVYLPFASGAIALFLRVQAHYPRARKVLRNLDNERELAAAQLMAFAPRLFERDMCLIELMLAQLRFGGIDGDNTKSD